MALWKVFKGTQRGFIAAVDPKTQTFPYEITAEKRAELVLQEPAEFLGYADGCNQSEAEENIKRELAHLAR
jgi:hypothetical protein